ncbi:MAG: glucokinase [Pseudomonadota bacterium]
MSKSTTSVLAGDIGGTNTRLAVFNVAGQQPEILARASYPSQQYASLQDVIAVFLETHRYTLQAACFGVAGPVHQQEAKITNLPWQISAADIAESLELARVSLLNDLEATAWGLRTLKAEDFHTLQQGTGQSAGNAAIIAAGTGLGEAGLYFDGQQYHPFACEGGHTDFSPQTELGMALLRYLSTRHEHVSWERVVSGTGLVSMHECLCQLRQRESPDWLQQAMREGDPAAAISEAAQQGHDAICEEALDMFVHLYGVEAGNLALKLMATGGLYIAGGIAPKILPQMQNGTFMDAFLAKGRMRGLLERIPVRVVLNDEAALQGAAIYAAAYEI